MEAIADAPTLMEFYLRNLRDKLNISAPEGKKKYFGDALSYLTRIKDIAERGHYVSIVASTLGIGIDAVYDALKRPGAEKGIKVNIAREPVSSRPEAMLLKVLIRHPDIYTPDVDTAVEAFSDGVLRKAGMTICGLLRDKKAISAADLLDGADDAESRGRLALLLFREDEGYVEEPERMLRDSIRSVLNRGRVKPSTQEFTRESIKLLEEMGKSEVALEIRKRLEIGPQGKRH